jgi:hypothetical protein
MVACPSRFSIRQLLQKAFQSDQMSGSGCARWAKERRNARAELYNQALGRTGMGIT